VFLSDRDFHPTVGAYFQAHVYRPLRAEEPSSSRIGQVLISNTCPEIRGQINSIRKEWRTRTRTTTRRIGKVATSRETCTNALAREIFWLACIPIRVTRYTLRERNLRYFGRTIEPERKAYHADPATGVNLARAYAIQPFYVRLAPRRQDNRA
jgi:hypothetical protein